jgi:galactokinase
MIASESVPAQTIAAEFQRRYGQEAAVVCRAPGRVNLIGEHTDYNDGFVLPAAVTLSTWAAATPRDDHRLLAQSEAYPEAVDSALDARFERRNDWTDYVRGVVAALQEAGVPLGGASLLVGGNVPVGAGLSSSASLEIAVAAALLELAQRRLVTEQLARVCQRAENEYVGAPCGIMDQFVAAAGRAGHALFLDCRSLQYEYVPLPASVSLVVCNSMVKHSVGAGEYGLRREQCRQAVQLLRQALRSIAALRDVTLEQFERHSQVLPDLLLRRARHVITENARVRETVRALRSGDLENIGELMQASHASMRDDFEISCAELDLLVELARRQPGLVGSRMTGGGFGGCTVNLVRNEAVEAFRGAIRDGYQRQTGRRAEIYVLQAADGVQRIV